MKHYLDDNNKEARAFIDSEDGELFMSVCIGDKQYDFVLDEKELEIIRCLINQNKQNYEGKVFVGFKKVGIDTYYWCQDTA